ncbi:MAG TPA: plasmid mobilization relaxosome protein MobC [Burkholderiales bacterium]|nr:plasmid mobilization relaxosome protein MobC [Burkholderiales bacterium]
MMNGPDCPPVSGSLDNDFKNAAGVAILRDKRETPPPFSLRLTFEERAVLEKEAGNMPLGAYIRKRLFGSDERPRRTLRKPVKDDQALAKLLGELGTLRLANNLNQLAKAANTGSLPVTNETEQALLTACEDVRQMRASLIAALGIGASGPS